MKRMCLTKAAACLLAGLLLAACGAAASAGDTPASAPANAPADSAAAPEAAAAREAVADDTGIAYRGAVLTPGGDMAEALAALGDDYEYTEDISCHFEGSMDKTYTYPDVTIYTYPVSEDADAILTVDVTGDGVATARGTKLGDSLDAVLLAYNDLLQAETDGMRYTAEMDGILFTVTAQDGKVASITYEYADAPMI